MQWVRLLHLGSSRKATGGFEKKKNLCKVETGLEELVSRHPFCVATWLRVGLSLFGREVATRKWCRDLVYFG